MFDRLDYIYMPSRDVAADAAWFTDVLSGRLIFAMESTGTRVAMIELTSGPPRLLLASHLAVGPPILIYRVDDLQVATTALRERGFEGGRDLEIPMGPALSFTGPGGHRVAIYERTRAFVENGFEGRRDF